MRLEDAVITDVGTAFTATWRKGKVARIYQRASYGISFATEGQNTYFHRGKSFVQDIKHAVILPQGKSYSLKNDVSGSFPVINFYTSEPLCDTIQVIEVSSVEALLACYNEFLCSLDSTRPRKLSLMYRLIDELCTRRNPPILAPAIEYINENYSSPDISNSDLSSLCHISDVYFRRLFRKHFNISPKQYVIKLRIEKAKRMLVEGKYKIWSVAESCGFESNSHFTKSFKAHVGTTPNEYQRLYQAREI